MMCKKSPACGRAVEEMLILSSRTVLSWYISKLIKLESI